MLGAPRQGLLNLLGRMMKYTAKTGPHARRTISYTLLYHHPSDKAPASMIRPPDAMMLKDRLQEPPRPGLSCNANTAPRLSRGLQLAAP